MQPPRTCFVDFIRLVIFLLYQIIFILIASVAPSHDIATSVHMRINYAPYIIFLDLLNPIQEDKSLAKSKGGILTILVEKVCIFFTDYPFYFY